MSGEQSDELSITQAVESALRHLRFDGVLSDEGLRRALRALRESGDYGLDRDELYELRGIR